MGDLAVSSRSSRQYGVCAVEPDQRSARRHIVNLAAYAREIKTDVLGVEISDLSTDGCRLIVGTALEPETVVWLKLPGVTPRRAVIRWSQGQEAGCEFETPITETVVDEVTQPESRS